MRPQPYSGIGVNRQTDTQNQLAANNRLVSKTASAHWFPSRIVSFQELRRLGETAYTQRHPQWRRPRCHQHTQRRCRRRRRRGDGRPQPGCGGGPQPGCGPHCAPRTSDGLSLRAVRGSTGIASATSIRRAPAAPSAARATPFAAKPRKARRLAASIVASSSVMRSTAETAGRRATRRGRERSDRRRAGNREPRR